MTEIHGTSAPEFDVVRDRFADTVTRGLEQGASVAVSGDEDLGRS